MDLGTGLGPRLGTFGLVAGYQGFPTDLQTIFVEVKDIARRELEQAEMSPESMTGSSGTC